MEDKVDLCISQTNFSLQILGFIVLKFNKNSSANIEIEIQLFTTKICKRK